MTHVMVGAVRIAILAVLGVVAARATGQVMSERLPGLPRFAEVRADVEFASVAIEPTTLVALYAEFVGEWCAEQSEIRIALAKAAGTDFEVIPSIEEVERAVAAVRRARSAHEARLDRFATRLSESLPEADRPAFEAVRGWWRVRAAAPGMMLVGFAQAEDVGDLVRREPIEPARRQAILAALEGNASDRREAYRRFDRAVGDATIAAARVAAAEGWTGKSGDFRESDGETQAFFTLYHAARQPDPATVAAVFDAQLAAFDAVAGLLPGSARRTVFDEIVRQHMGDQMRGMALGLPSMGPNAFPLRSPAEAGQMLVAWKGLPEESRTTVRKAISAWLAEDDAAVRTYFAERSGRMRAGEWPTSFQVPMEVQGARGQIARRHLESLAELSGATWLLEPSAAPIERDVARLTEVDREILGAVAPAVSASSGGGAARRMRSLLPALPSPEDAWSLERTFVDEAITRLPPVDRESARAILADLVGARAEAWGTAVEPEAAGAEAADRAAGAGTPDERQAAIARSADHRRAAFAASAALDRELVASTEAALGEGLAPFLSRWYASQRFQEGLRSIESDGSTRGNMDLERLGGALVDLAALASAASLPADVRAVLEGELLAEWGKLAALASAALLKRIETDALWRDVYSGRSSDSSRVQSLEAGILELRRAADTWRAEEDRLVPRLLAAAGDSAPMLAASLREVRFPSSCSGFVRVRDLRKAVAGAGDFAGRAPLLAALDALALRLEDLAERSIALTIPRRTIADLSDDDRWRIDGGRGWRKMDLMLGTGQLSEAANWLIAKSVPPEIAAGSPLLDRTLRSGTR